MQVNSESRPVRAQVFESLVSVFVMATVSTAVVPSVTDGSCRPRRMRVSGR